MMKKFLGIVCFIYASLIMYVWLRGTLDNYIAPNMQIYIKLSIIPFIVIGLVLVLNNKINYKFKVSDLVLLLPILFVFLSGDGVLSVSVAKVKATTKNRTKIEVTDNTNTNTNTNTNIDQNPNTNTNTNNDKSDTIEDFYFDIEEKYYSYLADYLTYMTGARKYVGKTIKAKGFAVDYSDYLTDEYFAFGRYMITCCAADAEFTGFMVKYPKEKIEYGKWYEVEGYLELGKDSEGYDVMTINPTSVKEVKQSDSNDYVYSCNTYGDKACEELQKFELEY